MILFVILGYDFEIPMFDKLTLR